MVNRVGLCLENWGLFAATPKPLRKGTLAANKSRCPSTDRASVEQVGRTRCSKPHRADYAGRGETVFPVRPAQFIVVPLIKPPRKPTRAILHAPLHSSAVTASDTSPKMPLATATASNQGLLDVRMEHESTSVSHRPPSTVHHAVPKRRLRQCPSRPTFRPAQWPVSPFVVALLCRCNVDSPAAVSDRSTNTR